METIRSNNEISEIFSSGKRFSNNYLTLIVKGMTEEEDRDLREHDHQGRVAFIAGKKNGNAVWRNSAKRRLREIYRHNISLFDGMDVLIIAKSNILNDSFQDVSNAFLRTARKISNSSQ